MKLVVDTSIVFSLFKAGSSTNKLLKDFGLELTSPLSLIGELLKYADLICSKSDISKELFKEDITMLPELIELVDASPEFKVMADKLISHKSDVPFIALALELNIPIWSNDAHFKKQSEVKVFTTKELVAELS